jgi:elongation factor P
MIDVNELRKGVTFELDGNLLKVLDYSHNKTGRGNANIKVKARNLLTGSIIERTFSSGQSVQDVSLDFANVSYLYNDGDLYYFMDNVTFEQPGIKKESLGDSANFLKEGMEVKLTFYKGEAIDVEIPTSVDLKVLPRRSLLKLASRCNARTLSTLEIPFEWTHAQASISRAYKIISCLLSRMNGQAQEIIFQQPQTYENSCRARMPTFLW